MKQFFKYTLASLLGSLLSLIVIFFILFGMIASIASFADKKVVTVKDNSVLLIELDKPIPERTPANPFTNFGIDAFDDMNILGLNDIKDQIEQAAKDDNIEGIYLDVSIIQARMATLESIRNSLKKFKESGKFIVTYSDVLSQKGYYLASIADKIYLSPSGMMDMRGLSMNTMFYKGLLNKLDIEMQVVRYGDYKSAVEPLLLEKMSEANKEQSLKYISGIWDHILKGINEERDVSEEKLNLIADSLLLRLPEDARKYGLVDDVIYKDEFYAELREMIGLSGDKVPEFVELDEYSKRIAGEKIKIKEKPEVAVIYAVGEIQMGEGSDEVIGSERISEAIREARKDSMIKSIVLRVNSPGGSGLASDIIWREVVLAKKEKPVIVSMGDLAASGGYYISCPADKIYAQPNTLTGSIGVFGVLPNIKGFLNNKLGITIDGVKTNDHADFGYPFKPLSDFERDVLQQNVDHFYMDFVQKVAKGRNMSIDDVKAIGSGRIWSGIDAMENGLVDQIGGLDMAIEEAAKMADIEDFQVEEYPELKNPFEEFFGNFGSGMKTKILKQELGATYRYYDYLKNISEMEPVQARIPFQYEIN
ncbi:MAG: signal peptide peptidase SppA [Bacteroidales bacterium]|nr:signal peptide peptidase SppA [Bacteroidales bacterium]